MAKTQPMISSRVTKDSLNLPVSTVTIRDACVKLIYGQEAPAKPHSPKKRHVLKGTQFVTEHISWPKEKWRTNESKIVLFGSKGSLVTTKHGIQVTVHSDSEAWWRKHHYTGIFLLICPYLSKGSWISLSISKYFKRSCCLMLKKKCP